MFSPSVLRASLEKMPLKQSIPPGLLPASRCTDSKAGSATKVAPARRRATRSKAARLLLPAPPAPLRLPWLPLLPLQLLQPAPTLRVAAAAAAAEQPRAVAVASRLHVCFA